MDYRELEQEIRDVIKTNGNQEITGANLQATLLAMTGNEELQIKTLNDSLTGKGAIPFDGLGEVSNYTEAPEDTIGEGWGYIYYDSDSYVFFKVIDDIAYRKWKDDNYPSVMFYGEYSSPLEGKLYFDVNNNILYFTIGGELYDVESELVKEWLYASDSRAPSAALVKDAIDDIHGELKIVPGLRRFKSILEDIDEYSSFLKSDDGDIYYVENKKMFFIKDAAGRYYASWGGELPSECYNANRISIDVLAVQQNEGITPPELEPTSAYTPRTDVLYCADNTSDVYYSVDGSLVVLKGSGGGSSIDVEDSLTSTSREDALAAYQGYLIGQRLNDLENNAFPTTLSALNKGASIYLHGTTNNVPIEIKVERKGVVVTSEYSFTLDNNAITLTNGMYTINGVTQAKTYTVKAINKADASKVLTKNISVTYGYNFYFGLTDQDINPSNITASLVKAGTKKLDIKRTSGAQYAYTGKPVAQKLFFACPTAYEPLVTIKDGNNFNVMTLYQRKDALMIDGVSYYVYMTTDFQSPTSDITMKFGYTTNI